MLEREIALVPAWRRSHRCSHPAARVPVRAASRRPSRAHRLAVLLALALSRAALPAIAADGLPRAGTTADDGLATTKATPGMVDLAALASDLAAPDGERRASAEVVLQGLDAAATMAVAKRLETILTDDPTHHPTGTAASYAAWALADLGAPGAAALLAALHHPEPRVRAAAADAVAQLGPAAVAAVPRLTWLLADEVYSVRLRAAWSLRRIGPAAATALPSLVAHLRERPNEADFVTTLAAFGALAAPAVPMLIDLLQGATGAAGVRTDLATRCAAIDALTAVGPAAGAAVPILLAQPPDQLCYEAKVVRALAAIGVPALPDLLAASSDADLARRRVAVGALAALAPRHHLAHDPLALALLDPEPGVRRLAVEGLGSLTEPGDEIGVALARALDDPDPDVRDAATSALRRRDSPASRQVLATYAARQSAAAAAARAAGQPSPGARAILDLVPCANAEEVATVVFDGYDFGPWDDRPPPVDVWAGDLGDGTRVFVFSPPGGNGSWAWRPNYHFALEGDRLRLVFDGNGVATSYLTEAPKLNGRYQLRQVQRADTFGELADAEVDLATATTYWFWHQGAYQQAFSDLTIEQARNTTKVGTSRRWLSEAAWRAARRSWRYRVQSGDTLHAICARFELPCDGVVRQNGLANVDQLRTGGELHYDSHSPWPE